MKAKLPAILAFVTTLFGVAASPAFLSLLSVEHAAIVIALGSLWQAVTKAINHDEK